MPTNAAKNYKVKFRMLRRYRKIKEDMPLSAAKIEDDTLASEGSASKQMSFISFYLLLSTRQAELAKLKLQTT